MAWTVVPCLDELRDQLNAAAPNRDKNSDGSVGDTSHAAGRSSHNPDRTGNPEYADGDTADEVRARDFDVDLRQPGLTMLDVVRHLVAGARAGRFWWLRYVIFQGVIYHRSTGWAAREYTGVNSHHHHAHVNSDFTQAADTVRGVDYGLDEINMPTAQEIAAAVWATDMKLPDGRTVAAGTVLAWRDQVEVETRRQVLAAITALAAKDQVDEQALARELAPVVAQLVVAALPAGVDQISQDEVTTAVKTALRDAFAS